MVGIARSASAPNDSFFKRSFGCMVGRNTGAPPGWLSGKGNSAVTSSRRGPGHLAGISRSRYPLPDLHPHIIRAVHLIAGFDAEGFVEWDHVRHGTGDAEEAGSVDVGLDADGQVL